MIGDVHMDLTYRRTSESCNDDFPDDKLGPYGNYECDSPYKLVESAFTALNDVAEGNDVDLLFGWGKFT